MLLVVVKKVSEEVVMKVCGSGEAGAGDWQKYERK